MDKRDLDCSGMENKVLQENGKVIYDILSEFSQTLLIQI